MSAYKYIKYKMRAILFIFKSMSGVFVPIENKKNPLYSDLLIKSKHPEYLSSINDRLNLQNDVNTVLRDLNTAYRQKATELL